MLKLFSKMKSMYSWIVVIGLGLLLSGAHSVLAAETSTSYRSGLNSLGGALGLQGNPNAFIGIVITGVLALIGIVALVLIIYAGFLWLVSQGDSTKITKAKNIMIYASIGLIIILASYLIVHYVIFNVFLSATSGGF